MLNAPAGSTTMASSLYSRKIVVHTFPSGTRIISSRFFRQMSKFKFPTCFTAAPSTNLSMLTNGELFPAAMAVFMAGAPKGSTPIILVLGLNARNTSESPEANPPPPMGTKT